MQKADEKWALLWKKSKGSVFQSYNFLQSGSNKIVKQIKIEQNNELVAAIGAYEIKVKTPLGERRILEAHGTPLALSSDLMLELLEKYKEESKNYWYGTITPSLREDYSLFKEYHRSNNHTIVLDLTKSEDELWSLLEKKSIRWGINYATRKSLKVISSRDKKLRSDFYRMYLSTAKEGGFSPEEEKTIESIEESGIGKMHYILSEVGLVAGGLVILDINKKNAVLDLTALSDEGKELQAMPFLYWNMILDAKKSGFLLFDLGGYDADAKEGEKTANINKFKERFGGTIVEQPVFSTNMKYSIIRKILPHVRSMKKMYKKG